MENIIDEEKNRKFNIKKCSPKSQKKCYFRILFFVWVIIEAGRPTFCIGNSRIALQY